MRLNGFQIIDPYIKETFRQEVLVPLTSYSPPEKCVSHTNNLLRSGEDK